MHESASSTVLSTIKLLVNGPKKIVQLAQYLDKSERQVHRIVKQIEELGYLIDQDENNAYYIFGINELNIHQFTPEEVSFLTEQVLFFNPTHPLAESVFRKLKGESFPIPLAAHLHELTRGNNFNNLKWAIRNKCLVYLKPYQSGYSNKPDSNRLVLPLLLLPQHRQVVAYEKSTRLYKTFKLDRIGIVEITNLKIERAIAFKHKQDPFGYHSKKVETIELQMSRSASQLMMEEYPGSQQYIHPNGSEFIYKGPMANPFGIGRFILGLPGEVIVKKGETLKSHIKERLKLYTLK
jgi:proteasome accessory factor C